MVNFAINMSKKRVPCIFELVSSLEVVYERFFEKDNI